MIRLKIRHSRLTPDVAYGGGKLLTKDTIHQSYENKMYTKW